MSAVIEFPQIEGNDEARDQTSFGDIPPIMSPKTLAEIIEVHPVTLAKCREKKKGPRSRTPKGTNLIRYYRRDVLAWLDGESE